MDWPTIAISGATAIVVAFLGPRFQHFIWRTQKIREQRIAVAERFAKIGTALSIFAHSSRRDIANRDELLETGSLYLEQFSILVLVRVLFDDPQTLASCDALKAALDETTPDTASVENVGKLHALRVQLLACLFAEAFGVSTKKLIHRAKM